MGIKHIDALIMYASDLKKTVEFYRKLGVPLETEEHEEGPLHYACELGHAHVAVYESKPGAALMRGFGGASQFGLRVDSLEETYGIAVAAGAKTIIAPMTAPWGRRAVIEDPDGRPVELNQGPNT